MECCNFSSDKALAYYCYAWLIKIKNFGVNSLTSNEPFLGLTYSTMSWNYKIS